MKTEDQSTFNPAGAIIFNGLFHDHAFNSYNLVDNRTPLPAAVEISLKKFCFFYFFFFNIWNSLKSYLRKDYCITSFLLNLILEKTEKMFFIL